MQDSVVAGKAAVLAAKREIRAIEKCMVMVD
jgi:hypothetical protein